MNEYAGYTFTESEDRRRITVRMTVHVLDAVSRIVPELLQGRVRRDHQDRQTNSQQACGYHRGVASNPYQSRLQTVTVGRVFIESLVL